MVPVAVITGPSEGPEVRSAAGVVGEGAAAPVPEASRLSGAEGPSEAVGAPSTAVAAPLAVGAARKMPEHAPVGIKEGATQLATKPAVAVAVARTVLPAVGGAVVTEEVGPPSGTVAL